MRSVNHRFLDVSVRLPETLRFIEPQIRDRLSAAIARGKVDLSIRWRAASEDQTEIVLNETRLDALLQTLSAVNQRLPQAAPADPMAILQWPGVIMESELDEAQTRQALMPLVDQAIAAFNADRAREGSALLAGVETRLHEIEGIVQKVQAELPSWEEQLTERLEHKMSKLPEDVDPNRVAQEVALLLQKSDVSEELDRLAVHTQEFRRALKRPEAVGRRLDFLLQELHREANTLSVKLTAPDLSPDVIQLKVLIEQIREQIQNIE
jgi:uncharacterized protein (TIGR00255 family)